MFFLKYGFTFKIYGRLGVLISNIETFVATHKIDLIVMGTIVAAGARAIWFGCRILFKSSFFGYT
ncbi:hypothetical protein [Winogradskyella wichelsiae]|uniref:hypothetical protein n=1 Tax=Winogradskyella wichelsiae TaxID=2697007 RepID=UPI0015C709B3|nr:hypothetical protein [Winogradskyella wichelsiae]